MDFMKKPAYRRLKGYAFDPSLSLKNDTFSVNEMIYKVPWVDCEPGPTDDYIEIIDYDPTVKSNGEFGVLYDFIDLHDGFVLANDGVDADENDPKFHQQMVYAVAKTTIGNFERALGRKIFWRDRFVMDKKYNSKKIKDMYTAKLRIYPHALREPNAYYSPSKAAILFGYFKSTSTTNAVMPGSWIYTCLSHDIIAHEVTHAILDGMNKFYNEPTNKDVLAFHEAFADIVALFQHFTFPEVLRNQISKTKGDLSSQNLLGQLAQQFGKAISGHGSLRDAIGKTNPKTKKWERTIPNPMDYQNVTEPHARGSILVAAVFDAFINIYTSRTRDLLRLASGGTGILPEGELHPDLVNRLAKEASKSAKHVLNMCIRALDYCPPVDITFGDFFRAIITSDMDLVDNDQNHYRLAFIDAFKKRGIYPEGIKTLSIDSVLYPNLIENKDYNDAIAGLIESLEVYGRLIRFETDRSEIYRITKEFIANITENENENHDRGLHKVIKEDFGNHDIFEDLFGIILSQKAQKAGINFSRINKTAKYWVTHLREVNRIGPNGNKLNQIIFSVIQTANVYKDGDNIVPWKSKHGTDNKISFRGGATLIFDMDKGKLTYSIKKPINSKVNSSVIDSMRVYKQGVYQLDEDQHGVSELEREFGLKRNLISDETFALLHNH